MEEKLKPKVLKRTPTAWKKTAIVRVRVWNHGAGSLAKDNIKDVFHLMSLVNRTSNYLSKLAHQRRIFNKGGMQDAFRDEVREYMPCTGRIFDMASVKVSRAYKEEIDTGRGFLALRPPLRWKTKDPIYIPQRSLDFREICHIRMPTLYRKGISVRAIFGRYRYSRFFKHTYKMTGQARLMHKAGIFWLDLEVPVEEGAVFEEVKLGVDEGVLATLYASHIIIEKINEIKAKAQARIKEQEAELRVILEQMKEEARHPSPIKVYGTVKEGMKEMAKSGEIVRGDGK